MYVVNEEAELVTEGWSVRQCRSSTNSYWINESSWKYPYGDLIVLQVTSMSVSEKLEKNKIEHKLLSRVWGKEGCFSKHQEDKVISIPSLAFFLLGNLWR